LSRTTSIDCLTVGSFGGRFDARCGADQYERAHLADPIVERFVKQHAAAHGIAQIVSWSTSVYQQAASLGQVSSVVTTPTMAWCVHRHHIKIVRAKLPKTAPTASVLGETVRQRKSRRVR